MRLTGSHPTCTQSAIHFHSWGRLLGGAGGPLAPGGADLSGDVLEQLTRGTGMGGAGCCPEPLPVTGESGGATLRVLLSREFALLKLHALYEVAMDVDWMFSCYYH